MGMFPVQVPLTGDTGFARVLESTPDTADICPRRPAGMRMGRGAYDQA